jgi:phosphatidylglycerol:prolipoprotein diacylglycerol transferase
VVFGLYLILSGTARFLVEFLRINQPAVFGLTQPQLWSALLVLIGLVILVRHRRRVEHPAPDPATAVSGVST